MKNIVVLGGGYGGVRIIKNLLSKGLPKDCKITLIDRTPYHSLKTEFYALAAGTVSDKETRLDFPESEQLEKVFGEIIGVDVEKQEVTLREMKEKIKYDYLVIGLGCEDNYHGIEGAKEFTDSLQTIKKARITSQKLNNLDAYKQVTIVGGGLSGIEIASEIRESRPDLNIRLLDRGDSILRPFDKKIQEYVTQWFYEREVEIVHNSNVDYVEKDVVCNKGQCLFSDVNIWTAGVRPNYIVRSLPIEKDNHDRIVINEYHQVPSHNNIYVVGDVASLPHSPSAQLAQQQGDQVADVLFSILRGQEPKKPGELQLKGVLGSLGKHDGFGSVFNLPFVGLLPRIAKTGVLWLHKRH